MKTIPQIAMEACGCIKCAEYPKWEDELYVVPPNCWRDRIAAAITEYRDQLAFFGLIEVKE